jgi:hypothetical protein
MCKDQVNPKEGGYIFTKKLETDKSAELFLQINLPCHLD